MKILQINNVHYRRGGADAVYLNTSELLLEHGDEVVFFNMLKTDNLPCKDERYWVSSLESRGGGLRSQIIELCHFFYNTEAKKKIEDLILAERPDIAHIHLFWGSGISPSIVSVLKKYHIPLVQTVHDYRMICPVALLLDRNGHVCEKCKGKHFYWAPLNRCSKHGFARSLIMAMEMYFHNLFFNPLKVVDGFIFVSRFSFKKHLQYLPRLKDANSTILYNFVSEYGECTNDSREAYLLFYGRISYEKGLSTLLEAVKRCPEIQLKVVGSGPMEMELKTQYDDCLNITFLGYQTGDRLKYLVNNAKYVCVPSECYENNPMTIVEAYSMGVPVIGSRIGGIPEIVNDGKTGFLFKTGDVENLVETISRASLISTNEYEAMCNAALVFFEEHFNSNHYYQQLKDFYKQTLRKYEY